MRLTPAKLSKMRMPQIDQLSRFVGAVIVAVFLMTTSGCGRDLSEPPTLGSPTPIVVTEYRSPVTFDFKYPMEWSMTILTTGMMVIAPSEVLSLSANGPSVTIFRVAPGLSEPTLALSLDEFLRKGPLDENFVLASDIRERQIGQYQGLSVDLERTESEDFVAMTGYIVAVETNSGAVYYFMATAPSGEWIRNWPLMLAIYQSVVFNE